MKLYGLDYLDSALELDGYLFKMVLNESGALFFPSTTEHRDAQVPGLRYADDSMGNALAAIIKPGKIEYRFHRDYSDERVLKLTESLLQHTEHRFASGFQFTYQGRVLISSVDQKPS